MEPSILRSGFAEFEWSIEETRSSSQHTLRVAGRLVHSEFDPVLEAERTAKRVVDRMIESRARLLILIGVGLGYLADALAARAAVPIIVWEPFAELEAQVATRWSPPRPSIRLVRNPAEFDAAVLALAKKGQVPHLEILAGYEPLTRFEARYASCVLRHVLTAGAPLRFPDSVICQRSLEVLARLPSLQTIDSLDHLLEGQTVIIASPGPSLQATLPLLRSRRCGVVLAAVQALPALADAGVFADFAIVSDPRDYSAQIEGLEEGFGVLLADTLVGAPVLDRHAERTVLFNLRSRYAHQIAWQELCLPMLDEPLVSVSETAFALARSLGARRFLLAGVDFGSDRDDGRYIGSTFRARNLSGDFCWTNPTYLHGARYLSWASGAIAGAGMGAQGEGCGLVGRVGNGLAIEGARAMTTDDFAAALSAAAPFELPDLADITVRERIERESKVRVLLRRLEKRNGAIDRQVRDKSSALPEELPLLNLNKQEREEPLRLARDLLDARLA